MANRVDETTKQAIKGFALACPVYGQARTSNELRKLGIFVSQSGVRSNMPISISSNDCSWLETPLKALWRFFDHCCDLLLISAHMTVRTRCVAAVSLAADETKLIAWSKQSIIQKK
jgi:predicted membrane channel-forming protein YqfA (hemolysin III family)